MRDSGRSTRSLETYQAKNSARAAVAAQMVQLNNLDGHGLNNQEAARFSQTVLHYDNLINFCKESKIYCKFYISRGNGSASDDAGVAIRLTRGA